MVQINFTDKEMLTKVVYYGPGLCGKTTNLQVLHQITDPDGKSKLFSINTEQDRTLFFDLLPLNVGKIGGYSIKIQVFTVPGQVHYASTRRAVIAGTDAVVFVADSGKGCMESNQQSLGDLAENCGHHGLDMAGMPIALQYNKRDLSEVYSVEEMQEGLNSHEWPFFEAVAIQGKGVLDTFIAVAQRMVDHIVKKYRLSRGKQGQNFGEQVALALEAYRKGKEFEDTKPIDIGSIRLKYDLPRDQKEPDPGGPEPPESSAQPQAMSNTDLVERAVSANMELANLYIQLDETKKELDARINQLEAVKRVGETITSVLDIDRLLLMIGKVLGEPQKDCVCIALVEGRPPDLKPRTSYMLQSDPIFNVRADKGKTLAHLLAHLRRPSIVTRQHNSAWFGLIREKYPNIEGVISFPLISHRRLLGLVNIITTNPKRNFEERDLQFYTATSQFLSTAIENASLHSMLTKMNRGLEHKVTEFNSLKEAFDSMVKERTTDLAEANKALTRTTQEVLDMDETKDKFMKLLSQEIQVPLSVISETMNAVSENVSDPDAKAKLAAALKEARGIDSLIVSVTDLMNLEHGKVKFDWRVSPLADCVRQGIRLHAGLIRQKDISVLTRLDKDLMVRMDVEWLARAFSQIIHNAVKFSGNGGKIKVWSDVYKNAALIYIRDYGKGIPNEQREQVFNKYQVIEGNEYCDDGFGLGLPMARVIAEEHQGLLDVLEPPQDANGGVRGSLFRLSLPFISNHGDLLSDPEAD